MTKIGARRGWLRTGAPALLATLGSAGLLYLVARTALVALNPVAAVQFPPLEYSRLLRLRLYELLAQRPSVPPEVMQLARQTAAAEPLAFEPFFVAARAAEQRGRLAEAIRLMEEARRRRRSSVPTRLQLAAYYSQSGRLAEALREFEVVLRLRPEVSQAAVVELLKLVGSRQGRQILAEALVQGPAWGDDFYAAGVGHAIPPEHALALLEEIRARTPRADHSQPRRLYINALLNAGQVRRARALWLETIPPGERRVHALMANGGLRGRPAGEPFAWTFRATDVGRAEIRDRSTQLPYIHVDYFGGSNAVLAEQLIALQPGSYRLRYRLAGEGGSDAPNLFWTVRCLSGSAELLRKQLTRLTPSYQAQEAAFAVPAGGCEGQHLRLVGEAGDVPVTVSARIAAVELVR